MKYYMIEGQLNEDTPIDENYKMLNYEHHAYIQKYFDEGKIIASGPMTEGRGGVIFLRLNDNESAEEFCDNDPLTKAKIHHYRITQFTPHFAQQSLIR